jgi:RHS repeat-associated protein
VKLHEDTDSEVYGMDGIGRLTHFQRGTVDDLAVSGAPVADVSEWNWTLDKANNWAIHNKTAASGDVDASRTHANTNEITTQTTGAGTTTLVYDANGNLVDDGVHEYKWDFKNRLREVDGADSGDAVGKYWYDAENRRTVKVVPDAWIEVYFLDAAEEVADARCAPLVGFEHQYVQGQGIDDVLLRDDVLLPSLAASRTCAVFTAAFLPTPAIASCLLSPSIPSLCWQVNIATRRWFLQDEQESVYALADNWGVIMEGYEYDPYGAVTVYQGSSGVTFTASDTITTPDDAETRFLYTGRAFDAETGLHYYRTRYLSSELGRFITRDTIGVWGDAGSLGNGYGFGGNRGHFVLDAFGTCSGFWSCLGGFFNPDSWSRTGSCSLVIGKLNIGFGGTSNGRRGNHWVTGGTDGRMWGLGGGCSAGFRVGEIPCSGTENVVSSGLPPVESTVGQDDQGNGFEEFKVAIDAGLWGGSYDVHGDNGCAPTEAPKPDSPVTSPSSATPVPSQSAASSPEPSQPPDQWVGTCGGSGDPQLGGQPGVYSTSDESCSQGAYFYDCRYSSFYDTHHGRTHDYCDPWMRRA